MLSLKKKRFIPNKKEAYRQIYFQLISSLLKKEWKGRFKACRAERSQLVHGRSFIKSSVTFTQWWLSIGSTLGFLPEDTSPHYLQGFGIKPQSHNVSQWVIRCFWSLTVWVGELRSNFSLVNASALIMCLLQERSNLEFNQLSWSTFDKLK